MTRRPRSPARAIPSLQPWITTPLPFEKAPVRASAVLDELVEVVGEDGRAAAGRPRAQSDPQAKPTRNTKSSNPRPMENHGASVPSDATGP
eukprot:16146043-Heterocapsa_arctica.AAC.1